MNFSKTKLIPLGIITVGVFGLLSLKDDAFAKYKVLKYFHKNSKNIAQAKLYNPFEDITFTPIKDYGGVTDIGSPHFMDVVSHTNPSDQTCPRSSGMAFSPDSIRIHETEHMLNCQIQRFSGTYDPTIEGLYYANGNGIILTKPKTKVTDFAPLIPEELREKPSPYQTYIVEQMIYPSLNNIGYLFNEWSCYRSNITLNMEFEQIGRPEPDNDSHAANYSPHFFGYMAIAMHYMLKNEPEALQNKQLKAAFALYSEATWFMMNIALSSPTFGKPNTIHGSHIAKLMSFYRYSPKFAEVKNSLITIYGEEWVNQLMKASIVPL